jgi:hypothetical protein
MTDSVRDTSRAAEADSPLAQKEWQPPTLTLIGDVHTLTKKGSPVNPAEPGGTAGDGAT